MIYGPLPKFCIERLREILNGAGHEPHVYTDEDLLEKVKSEQRAHEPTSHPTFRSQIDSLHIEIPDEHFPLVKEELEKMGIAPVDPSFDPGFDAADAEDRPLPATPVIRPYVKGGDPVSLGFFAVAAVAFLIYYFFLKN